MGEGFRMDGKKHIAKSRSEHVIEYYKTLFYTIAFSAVDTDLSNLHWFVCLELPACQKFTCDAM